MFYLDHIINILASENARALSGLCKYQFVKQSQLAACEVL